MLSSGSYDKSWARNTGIFSSGRKRNFKWLCLSPLSRGGLRVLWLLFLSWWLWDPVLDTRLGSLVWLLYHAALRTLCPIPQLLPSALSCGEGPLSLPRVGGSWKLSFSLLAHFPVFTVPGPTYNWSSFHPSCFLVSKKGKTKQNKTTESGKKPHAAGILAPGRVFLVNDSSGHFCW